MSALTILNQRRKAAGVAPLHADRALKAEARHRAQALAAAGALSHTGAQHAEVLTWGRLSETAVIAEWLGSPPHRDVLLSPGYQRAGLTRLETAPGRWLWVGVFA